MTGIDIVERALRRARQRANEGGVELRLVHGDVTGLVEAGVGFGFRLMLDTGTFHGLTDAQRKAMGRAVSAVAAPDATLISPALPHGAGAAAAWCQPGKDRGSLPGLGGHPMSRVADSQPDALARLSKRRALLPVASKPEHVVSSDGTANEGGNRPEWRKERP